MEAGNAIGDGANETRPLKVVIVEDQMLLREGIIALLRENGVEVAGHADDAAGLRRLVQTHKPDVAIVDVRLPPTFTDEGIRAAVEVRRGFPGVGILILSQYIEPVYTAELMSAGGDEGAAGGGVSGEPTGGIGYLLKERVGDVPAFLDAVRRVAAGGTALDREVVAELVGRNRDRGPGAGLDSLTPRELEVLQLMAEGRTNTGIAEALVVTYGAVEKHVTSIFSKLDLPAGADDHRRVLAVLTYLRSTES